MSLSLRYGSNSFLEEDDEADKASYDDCMQTSEKFAFSPSAPSWWIAVHKLAGGNIVKARLPFCCPTCPSACFPSNLMWHKSAVTVMGKFRNFPESFFVICKRTQRKIKNNTWDATLKTKEDWWRVTVRKVAWWTEKQFLIHSLERRRWQNLRKSSEEKKKSFRRGTKFRFFSRLASWNWLDLGVVFTSTS